VALAGALAMEPDLLVLDEPFEGLDSVAKSELAHLLSHLHARHHVSMVVSTHEINLVPSFVDTVYLLARGGRIVMKGAPLDLFSQPELLAQHSLEPPVLAVLFQELRRRGLRLDTALDAHGAAGAIARLLCEPDRASAAPAGGSPERS
jgi:cobalt/nickel transport system ATP-binding protein